MLLNVAVGGGWPGNPDASTVFPQTMLVDYLRVYEPASRAPAGSAAH
jgi:beta-glucanase (GH16 family)